MSQRPSLFSTTILVKVASLLSYYCCVVPTLSFSVPSHPTSHNSIHSRRDVRNNVSATSLQTIKASSSALHSTMESKLYQPSKRNEHYGSGPNMNVAQYLLDLDDAKGVFNFCGGMMFQLVLTDKLREYLIDAAASYEKPQQPFIFDSDKLRMFQVPNYDKSASADNIKIFHGREIRKVPNAEGDMGFVLQLSLANTSDDDVKDSQGWTEGEVSGYDGWAHDVGRTWRDGDRLVKEGFTTFQQQFGKDAFTLNHRCYLHFDSSNRMWLSAEDGCEGFPDQPNSNPFSKVMNKLFV